MYAKTSANLIQNILVTDNCPIICINIMGNILKIVLKDRNEMVSEITWRFLALPILVLAGLNSLFYNCSATDELKSFYTNVPIGSVEWRTVNAISKMYSNFIRFG